MKPLIKKERLGVVLFLVGMGLASLSLADTQQGRGGVSRELQKNIGLPALTGEVWQKMDGDSKIAFIWGLWETISIESYLMQKYPDLNRENFSAKMEEAAEKSRPTVDQTVALIDQYYRENSDHLKKPVVGVIWAQMVKPYITVGINGRPLKPNK
jgi:hypothetical protein